MRKIILLCLLACLLLLACNKSDTSPERYTAFDKIIDHAKPLALGDDRDVYVFCDPANWKNLEPFIRSAIETEVPIVYPEKYFNLVMANVKKAEALGKYKNILYIGDLESSAPVSAYMKSVLAKDFITRVQKSGGDLFIAKNHSSRDQIVLFLLGKDALSLSKIGAVQADPIFSLLLKRYTERQGYYAYQGKVIAESFFDPYPFSLQIPDTFRLFSNDKEGRFLSFLYRAKMQNREIPDKYLSVYHEAMQENKVDLQWLLTKRKELAIKYFEGDEFDPQLVRTSPFRYGSHQGYRILGAWKNMKLTIGGGFQAFAFWDEATKTAYLVDNIVYFPAGDKLPVLIELYTISHTLKIK
ncbi:MAG: DUF4837 family protein [Candidatus Cloacimonas sp.]|jgi:hypothetical protein|nr:DUF4837 family protein [Candidatus Cloacimonas sp.]